MTTNIILWIYIFILLAGGVAGFVKAKSKISLLMSVVFAIPLALCALGYGPSLLAGVLLFLLFVFFGYRFHKTKGFMPGGLMAILSAATLLLWSLL